MGSIIYASQAYQNGVPYGSDDVYDVMKIQFTDVPVVGEIKVGAKQTDYKPMTYVGTSPTIPTIAADITFSSISAWLDLSDPLKLPRVQLDTVDNKWKALFSIKSQGTFSYNSRTYIVTGSDDVAVEVLLNGLTNPIFETDMPFIPNISAFDGKVDKADSIPKYRCTIDLFNLKVSGKTTVFVPLVTQEA